MKDHVPIRVQFLNDAAFDGCIGIPSRHHLAHVNRLKINNREHIIAIRQ